jgi:glycosyltransferase involved in cell wall biosynthesis
VVKRDGFTVLCVCKLYPRKRVEILLQAAAQLARKIRGLQVRIVGDGPEENRLQDMHAALELHGIVEWLGFLPPEQLAAEYRACDLFCLPSVQEGFGIVFLEAMAAGAPIIACRAAAIPEVVTAGRLVRPDDPRALADALHHLSKKPEIRQQLGLAGRAAVGAFDAPVVAKRFLDALAQLLTIPR